VIDSVVYRTVLRSAPRTRRLVTPDARDHFPSLDDDGPRSPLRE
jgi:hypothetical protein